jgi:hypothetical protein
MGFSTHLSGERLQPDRPLRERVAVRARAEQGMFRLIEGGDVSVGTLLGAPVFVGVA